MSEIGMGGITTDLQTRNELIALSQLLAMNLNKDLFRQGEPVIIILNGSGSAGKSLVPTAFGAQLMNIRTSNVDVIGETTWQDESSDQPAPMRLHFIDAAEVCDNPYDLMKEESGAYKDLGHLKKELKGKGDVIFLQNVPHEFRDICDIEFIVSHVDGFGDWDRLVSIMVQDKRVLDDRMSNFFRNFRHEVVEAAAAQLPDNYLLPDGGVYGPVLETA